MAKVDVKVESPVVDSFRVQQLSSMFDVPVEKRAGRSFSVELPDLAGDWSVGVIVGPSGSGKTTIARKAFGDNLYQATEWPDKKSILDGFPDGLETKVIFQTLTAVGFSTPPAWLRPYQVLSNGERFRCDLARSLISGSELVVFDEFTSVVDRQVAKICSAAVAKAVRKQHLQARRFVAVTCHYDVVDWLEADWVLDMEAGKLARGSLRRPPITIDITKASRDAWELFKPHHYLSSSLPGGSFYVGWWNGRPVACVSVASIMGYAGRKRISRVVVLPDFQGVGIGTRMMEAVAEHHARQGDLVSLVARHPAMICHCHRSERWKLRSVQGLGCGKGSTEGMATSSGKTVASFIYQLSALDHASVPPIPTRQPVQAE